MRFIAHVVKKHPYRSIAKRLSGSLPKPKVLGLTATLSYSVTSAGIRRNIEELCEELGLNGSCIFTASAEELVADGYHAAQIPPELAFESDLYNISSRSSVSLELPGSPDKCLQSFLKYVDGRVPPIHQLSLITMETVKLIEGALSSHVDFTSPIGMKGQRGKLSAWGPFAQSIGTKKTSCFLVKQLAFSLEHMYEAVRIIVNSKQCGLELAMHYLVFNGILRCDSPEDAMEVCGARTGKAAFAAGAVEHQSHLLIKLQSAWGNIRGEFYRLSHLGDVVAHQAERFGSTFRGIIFVQQRVTTHIIKHFLDTTMRHLGLGVEVIYATSSPATASLSVSKIQAQDRIRRFAVGDIQILVATSVAEEGMDIPAANCVIRFDPIQTPVSLTQSCGRARQEDSAFVVMQQNSAAKRDFLSLKQAEVAQSAAVSDINEHGINDAASQKRKKVAQQSREVNAVMFLRKQAEKAVTGTNPLVPAVATLNTFSAKVDGEVKVVATKVGSAGWKSIISFSRFLAPLVSAEGKGPTKSQATDAAAKILLANILAKK